jgi:hypothetical protein
MVLKLPLSAINGGCSRGRENKRSRQGEETDALRALVWPSAQLPTRASIEQARCEDPNRRLMSAALSVLLCGRETVRKLERRRTCAKAHTSLPQKRAGQG